MPISPQQLDAAIDAKYDFHTFIKSIDNQLVTRCGSFSANEPIAISTAWMPAQVAERIRDAYIAAGWGQIAITFETNQRDAGTTFTFYRKREPAASRNRFDEPNYGVER
jgi:hypothetical protein